ncbi:MAG: ATP-binding cassette domain-containing protein [Chitinophagaceae bacterium]|nr:ATP-binding cassette domain-containing protein [Chitinophagaceae bacterium]
MLRLIDTVKRYHSQLILHIPILHLQNDIYWVKGANGSGKTTFLKIIAGLLPFEGDIFCNDISLKNEPLAYRQNVGWAEAEPLYPTFLSGIDMIRLYCDIRKTPLNNAYQLIELFNMSGFINNAIGTYSSGMTKKLSLVLAFIGNPLLIILDEPLITLDQDAFSHICDLILDKHTNKKTCFIMSSHQELDTQLMRFGKELIVSNQTVS